MKEDFFQKVFSIYCDHVARDAVAYNDKLKAENEALQPVKDMLFSLQIRKCSPNDTSDLLVDINLLDHRGREDGNDYVFEMEPIEFTLDEAQNLIDVSVSGISMSGFQRQVNVGHGGEASMRILIHDFVSLVGTIQNALEEGLHVRGYDGLRRLLGMWDQNFGLGDNATFMLEELRVSKKTIEPCLNVLGHSSDRLITEVLDELQSLSLANADHKQLSLAAANRKSLLNQKLVLERCRELLGTVEVRHPGGQIYYDLKDCTRINYLHGDGTGQAWTYGADPISSIPLSHLSGIKIKVAGILIGCAGSMSVQWTNQALMIVNYDGVVAAVFRFGGEWNDVNLDSLPGGPRNYVMNHVMDRSTQGQEQDENIAFDESGLTMELVLLQIELNTVRALLDPLCIDVSDDTGEVP